MWGSVRGVVGTVYGVSVEGAGKCGRRCGGKLFLEKCLDLLCNISIALALQFIVAIPN